MDVNDEDKIYIYSIHYFKCFINDGTNDNATRCYKYETSTSDDYNCDLFTTSNVFNREKYNQERTE